MNNYSIFPVYNFENNTGPGQPVVDLVLAGNGSIGTPGSEDDLGDDHSEIQYESPPLLKQSPPMVALFTIAYGVVLFLAVINNCLVVTAIYRNQNLRTVTNMFVANLAIADITVSLLVLPITLLANLFTDWQFGPFLCRAFPYIQAVAVGASVNTLAAVAVERYLAIFHAGNMTIKPNQAFIVITVIWMIPACFQIPWAVFSKQQDFLQQNVVRTLCYQAWSKRIEKGFFLGIMFLSCYLIPLCFLAIFYSMIGCKVWKRSVAGIQGSKAEKNINRSKIRIVRMLIVVTLFFAISWLPLYSIRMLFLFGPKMQNAHKAILIDKIVPVAQWLGSANSCVNPFIYCYFSEHFRKAIVNIFKNCWCCRQIFNRNLHGSPRTQTTRIVLADGKTNGEAKASAVVMENCKTDGKVDI